MRLTRREYWLVVGVVVLTSTWALYAFGLAPVLGRIATLERVIPEKQGELNQLRIEAREYVSLHESIDGLCVKIAAQEKNFELLPFMESLVEQCGLTQNVTTMKRVPTQPENGRKEMVLDIAIESTTLRQLCDFLEKTQSPDIPVRVSQLNIKANVTHPNLVDSHIEFYSFKSTSLD